MKKRSASHQKKSKAATGASAKARGALENFLLLGQIQAEKCELGKAHEAFSSALASAQRQGDLRGRMEAIAGLLRLAGEALDMAAVKRWDEQLDQLIRQHPKQIPPMAWYCKGIVAMNMGELRVAQRYLRRYLTTTESPEIKTKGWVMLANVLRLRGRVKRSEYLCQVILSKFESEKYRAVNGVVYLILGNIYEKRKIYEIALKWYQKAHTSFMGEHNWYYHLYVLLAYARLNRLQKVYAQAYWFLDLVDQAASGSEFGLLRREVASERQRLEQDAVDLLIDSRRCVIQTREQGEISLGKQYVLLHILEALSSAHDREGGDMERGLSKAEIIEKVWQEPYRPESHDNKLYYNINRLRKLMEPDVKKPQYLLNWKEGYRLAPGLRIQFVGGAVGAEALRGAGN